MKKIATLSLLLISACSLAPDYQRPVTETPKEWSIQQSSNEQLTKDWWKKFGSSELDRLVDESLTNNKDIEAGLARIEQARAASKIAGSNLLPNVDASASTSENYQSTGTQRNSTNAGISVGYEVDLFGRNRANAEAATLREKATIFDHDSLTLLVASDVVNYYADYLSLSDRIAIAGKNLDNGKKVLKIVQAKYDEGRISALELSQQKAALANLETAIANLNNQRNITRSQLAILTGKPPQDIALAGNTITELSVPSVKPIQPGELLDRRPDIRAAEENLKAANLDIGAAKAEFFPRLQIGADTGLTLNPATLAANILASLAQPIFSGGALEGNLEQTEARKKELVANYSGAVLGAYKEVEDALSTVKASGTSITSSGVAKTNSQKAYDIAKIRYDEGKTDFQTLLDTQGSLFSAEDNYYSAEADSVKSAVALYKALGGGWRED